MQALRLTTSDKVLLVVLFLLTLALRGTYAYFHRDQLDPGGPQRTVAQSIVQEHAFRGTPPTAASGMTDVTTAYWEPAYPLLLAGVEAVAGERHAVTGRIAVQAVLAGLATVVFYLLALAVFNSTAVAGLTGLLTAASYIWIVHAARESDVVLAALLLGTWLLCTMRMADRPRLATGLGVALAAGLLMQTRVAAAPMVLVGTVWMMWRLRGRGAWAYGLGVVAVMLAALVPWTYRNAVVPWPYYPQGSDLRPIWQEIRYDRGHVVPVVNRLGYDLWVGNNDAATGGQIAYHQQYNRGADWKYHLGPTSVHESPRLYADSLPEPRRDLWYGFLAVRWIQQNPFQWLELRVKACAFFWTTQDLWLPERLSDLHLEQRERLLLAWVLMVLAAVVGMRWSYRWRHRTGLLTIALVCYPLYYIFGHATLGHTARAPLDGVLLVYAAFFLACFAPSVSANLRAGIGRVEPVRAIGVDDESSEASAGR